MKCRSNRRHFLKTVSCWSTAVGTGMLTYASDATDSEVEAEDKKESEDAFEKLGRHFRSLEP